MIDPFPRHSVFARPGPARVTYFLTGYKQQLESLELQPSSGGCFELTVNGKCVDSKLATGEFPDGKAMVAEVGRWLR